MASNSNAITAQLHHLMRRKRTLCVDRITGGCRKLQTLLAPARLHGRNGEARTQKGIIKRGSATHSKGIYMLPAIGTIKKYETKPTLTPLKEDNIQSYRRKDHQILTFSWLTFPFRAAMTI